MSKNSKIEMTSKIVPIVIKEQPRSEQTRIEQTIKPDQNKDTEKKTIRCMMCKKKLDLLGIKCICNNDYCSAHRYPEEHSCSMLDEKNNLQINKMIQENPKVCGKKINKI